MGVPHVQQNARARHGPHVVWHIIVRSEVCEQENAIRSVTCERLCRHRGPSIALKEVTLTITLTLTQLMHVQAIQPGTLRGGDHCRLTKFPIAFIVLQCRGQNQMATPNRSALWRLGEIDGFATRLQNLCKEHGIGEINITWLNRVTVRER